MLITIILNYGSTSPNLFEALYDTIIILLRSAILFQNKVTLINVMGVFCLFFSDSVLSLQKNNFVRPVYQSLIKACQTRSIYQKHCQIWIFKSFSVATASAVNKTWIFKSSSRNAQGNTGGSLALLNDCCHRAGGCFPSVSQTTYGNTI